MPAATARSRRAFETDAVEVGCMRATESVISPRMKLRKGFRQLVDEAKARITTIGLPEARERLGRDDVVFVDLRDIRELEREGMIPGAFHCPRGMLEFWRLRHLRRPLIRSFRRAFSPALPFLH